MEYFTSASGTHGSNLTVLFGESLQRVSSESWTILENTTFHLWKYAACTLLLFVGYISALTKPSSDQIPGKLRTKKRIEGWQLVWKRPRWNLPVKRDKRRKVKCRMLFGLIAFDIHPRSVCFSTKVTLCKAAHCAGLGAEKQRESVCQRVLWGHIGFTLIVMNVQLILGLQRDCGERVEDC